MSRGDFNEPNNDSYRDQWSQVFGKKDESTMDNCYFCGKAVPGDLTINDLRMAGYRVLASVVMCSECQNARGQK